VHDARRAALARHPISLRLPGIRLRYGSWPNFNLNDAAWPAIAA
jgi:hypothetical protein